MAEPTEALPLFEAPTPADMAVAASIVDSHPVVSAYAAVEWDELHEDGQIWIAAIVREARAANVFPDIGEDPLKVDRPDDRYEASRLRLRDAYVRQQQGVPDQTALVWRYDLSTVLEMALRLKAILSRGANSAEPHIFYTPTAIAKAFFERGFMAAAAWQMTKRSDDALSDAVLDHAWEHCDEGIDAEDMLPPVAPASLPDGGQG